MLSKTYTKYIQSLHHKKYRDTGFAFIAEGSKVVMELLVSKKFICTQVLALQAWMHEHEAGIKKYYDGPIQVIEEFELQKISALTTSNQVLAVFKKAKEEIIQVAGAITLVLDNIQDPGNLGTIIRIADWFGIAGIICSEDCVDCYNPKVIQSTMGSLGRVNILYIDIRGWLLQNRKIKVYAAALNGKNVSEIKGVKEAIIIIGNESKGISEEIMQLAGEKITIPKAGQAESLNAAVATGIILSHIV